MDPRNPPSADHPVFVHLDFSPFSSLSLGRAERIAATEGNRRADRPRARAKFNRLIFLGSLPDAWLRDKILVRSHHLSGQPKDSGYKANSIAFLNSTTSPERTVNPCLIPQGSTAADSRRTVRNESPDDAIPISGRWDAAAARCGGKSERKKNDCGTERSDRWESAAGGTARPCVPAPCSLEMRCKSMLPHIPQCT